MDKAKNKLQDPLIFTMLALMCCALWGSAFPCIKIGYRLFSIASGDTAEIILFAGVRFFLAGVMAVAAGSVLQRRVLLPARKELGGIAAVSLAQTFVQYALFYLGLAHTTSVRSSIMNGATVFFSVLITCVVFRQEKLSVRKVAGCLIGFLGILVMNTGLSAAPGQGKPIGDLLVLLACAASAVSASLTKIYSQRIDPTLLSGWQFVLGGAGLMAVGASMGGELSFSSAGCFGILLWLSFISAMAYTVWSTLLKHNSVSQITVYAFATPVFGVLLSALLLGEIGQAFRIRSLLALALVCAGILTINFHQRSRMPAAGCEEAR